MCGVIGFIGKNSELSIEIIKKLFLESSIRGKHATGMSYIKNGSLFTISEPVSAEDFIGIIEPHLFDEEIKLIGHTRYSTSDLNYNQPIEKNGLSIVVNGVITQSDPQNWSHPLGFKTKNDAEILLNRILYEQVLHQGSFAALTLSKEGELRHYRNKYRPLWHAKLSNLEVYASTQDIILRSTGCVSQKIKVEDDKQIQTLDYRELEVCI